MNPACLGDCISKLVKRIIIIQIGENSPSAKVLILVPVKKSAVILYIRCQILNGNKDML